MRHSSFPRRSISNLMPGLMILVLAATLPAQTATQTPTPDKRDLGIQSNSSPTSQAEQNKSKEAKPELVLQTGYNNFFGATRLSFSPDGRLLATATFRTNTIKLWETATGLELRDLSAGGQNATSLSPVCAFSPDNRLLAAAGGSNSVKVWDLTNGHEVQTLSGAQASFMAALGVTYVAFSSDGKKLVTVSDAIRVWDTTSWRETITLEMANINASGFTGGEGGVALNLSA